ncbi:MAG: (d)CMP kinase [Candidatus Promineifilaceae bacterium]
MIIAIDGPGASGKSTIGRLLAERLGYVYIDTGLMYRAVTLAALERGTPLNDEATVVRMTEALSLEFLPSNGDNDGRLSTVLLDGHDVTWELRQPIIDQNVSLISAYPGVRSDLVQRQRAIASRGNVVMVGRDIGTIVLPEADLKLFVVASVGARARRRWLERLRRDPDASYDQILADLVRRDEYDGSRQTSPMVAAADALVLDTTGKSPSDSLAEILDLNALHGE